MTRTLALLSVPCLLATMSSPALSAQAFDNDPQDHIRTTEWRLIRLLRDGVRASETFRQLVTRLQQSNVIVYLECGGTVSSGGRLTFITTAANWRYVHVRVARLRSRDVQIALIGHELQHAVEIADAPHVVDELSLAREYQRIGFMRPRLAPGMSFDSSAAIETGRRVLREISGRDTSRPSATALQLQGGRY